MSLAMTATRLRKPRLAIATVEISSTGGFSKTLARETARYHINVNVVCPGMTDTPLMQAIREQSEKTAKIVDAVIKATPFRRAAKPEEIAAMVVFLASNDSDFMTGQTLSVDGGLTMA